MIRILPGIVCIGLALISSSLFSQHVVINEVYGGGGNSGAVYKNDFIELYNPTSAAVDLTGWSIQYSSSGNTGTWSGVTALSGSIAPGGYYLVQEAAGAAGTTNLPTPDVTGSIAMSGTAGKIALVSSTTALSGASPTGVVDLVGYGSANGFEGAAPTAAPSNTLSVERKILGVDTDNNASDFQTASPSPKNKIVEFTSGYPKTQAVTATDLQIVINLNKVGTTYFVILPSGSEVPSSTQVMNGLNASDGPLASNLKGYVYVTTPSSDFNLNVTGLTAATSYDIYVVAENAGGLQTLPTELEINTVDPFAPNISLDKTSMTFDGFTDKSKQSSSETYTIAGSNLSTDLIISVTGNYLISKDDGTFSTSLTFASSDFAEDQTVFVRFNPSGNIGTQTGTITHSSTGTTDKQISLSAISIDPYHQNFNDPVFPTNSGWTQYSKAGAQVWASTNFGHTCLVGCNAGTVDKAAQINGFSGSAVTNEDWLISPELELSTYSNFAAMSFWTISAFAGDGLQLKYSTDYSGSGDPTLATWTLLDGKFPASNSNLWTESANVLLPKVDNLYIAFIYTSSSSAASRWTLDDWKVEDVSSYLNVSNFNFSFGEIVAGDISASRSFSFDAQGYGDITLTVSDGYKLSKDNETFSSSLLVAEEEAGNGQTIFVHFAPSSRQLKWPGSVTFSGNGLEPTAKGSLSGSSYSKAETFDVTAYNLEFFGTDVHDTGGTEFGPTDDALQVSNATTVFNTVQSDLFSVEEVSDDNALNQLVAGLPGYDKVMADRWSYSFDDPDPNFPPQKIGFIYNTSTVDVVDSQVMFAELFDDVRAAEAVSLKAALALLPDYPSSGGNTPSNFWSSGRLPFMLTADVNINNVEKRIRFIVLHSKSGSAAADYDRRKYDVHVLYDSLMAHYPEDNLIIMGDFNDDVDESIYTGHESTYKVFVDDEVNFKVLTYDLSQNGGFSFPSSSSFLDHIIISNELFDSYIANSIAVEDPRSYVNNYSNTTSDHLPVSARFALIPSESVQTITFNTLPEKTFGDGAFDLDAVSSSGLPVSYTSSDLSIASIEGATVTILKAGTVTIIASQPGNENYLPAVNVEQILVINKASQMITFDALADKTMNDAVFDLTATSNSSLTVSFSSTSDKIAINGTQATIVKPGRASIVAAQSGDENYNAAASVERSFCINPAKPLVTISNENTESPTLTSNASSGNQWYLNGAVISGGTNATLAVTEPGIYTVLVKADDCLSDFSNETPIVVTGLEKSERWISSYPNPANDYLFISGLEESDAQVSIIDVTGRTHYIKLEKRDKEYLADVSGFKAGVYVVRIMQGNTLKQIKLVKE